MSTEELQTKIKLLERQLEKERRGRKEIEEVLRSKMTQLYNSNQYLDTMTQRLQSALWAGNEVVWEFNIADNAYCVYNSINKSSASVANVGSFDDMINSVHEDERREFAQAWQAHISGKTDGINVTVRRFSSRKKSYRWISIRGKKVCNENDVLEKVIGVYKDVNTAYLKNQSFQTVLDAFLNYKYPAFIIDSETKHVEINYVFYRMLGLENTYLNQDALRKMFPTNEIIKQQRNEQRSFNATIQWNEQAIVKKITLSDTLSKANNKNETRYIVGFATKNES
ncbi:PAS domain-containing protein [Glaciecola sp. 2405UD65-10]|uniref:PAS domain-containing protein n=1 Tax=Glaciecola sp. 2405UD65-10 TaxID=3397244 RepID=UPI003B59864E